jgi:hypothetical protein
VDCHLRRKVVGFVALHEAVNRSLFQAQADATSWGSDRAWHFFNRFAQWSFCVESMICRLRSRAPGPRSRPKISVSPTTSDKSPQPPLSHPGATPDSDRAKKPPLAEPAAPDQELNPGDRVEGLGNFGKPTGEFGTVEQANEDDAVVKWDDDGRMRLRQPWLKKV